MNIAVRVDASERIGTGHFMRCLTLADALKERGSQIRFICRQLPEHFIEMLAAKGYGYFPLTSIPDRAAADDLFHSSWLGTSQYADAQDTLRALSDRSWHWLIVDHYALDSRWESIVHQNVHPKAPKILVIDDLADRKHDCDVLLDQNFYLDIESRYTGKVAAHCRLLLGPRYALLREEFRLVRKSTCPRTGPVKRILIFFGGIDRNNHTGTAMAAIAQLNIPGLEVDVVIGVQHPCRQQIERECVRYGFHCHVQTMRMAELMAKADLAIGAGGSASWERCCLGLPALAIRTADNQDKLIADSMASGLVYAPDMEENIDTLLPVHIKILQEYDYLRYVLSCNGMETVDGLGAMRVIEHMGINSVEVRVATQDDSDKIFEWRNHPQIRAVSREGNLISREEHQLWFKSVLCNPDRVLLIGQHNGSPLGVVRFDVQRNMAEVSIYLIPGTHHPRQGSLLLKSAEEWLIANRPHVSGIRANVVGGNIPSERLFSGGGYLVESTWYSKRIHVNG